MLFLLFFLLYTDSFSIEERFTARGIFVSIEYKGIDVRGSISYSVNFLTFGDLKYIWTLPFYMVKDIRNVDLRSSFRVKLYGQSFYVFKYLNHKDAKNKEMQTDNLSRETFDNDIDFFDYFSNYKNIHFYLIDFALSSFVRGYSTIPTKSRKAVFYDIKALIYKNNLFLSGYK